MKCYCVRNLFREQLLDFNLGSAEALSSDVNVQNSFDETQLV